MEEVVNGIKSGISGDLLAMDIGRPSTTSAKSVVKSLPKTS
jgi:hypothetical protein